MAGTRPATIIEMATPVVACLFGAAYSRVGSLCSGGTGPSRSKKTMVYSLPEEAWAAPTNSAPVPIASNAALTSAADAPASKYGVATRPSGESYFRAKDPRRELLEAYVSTDWTQKPS